MKSSFSSRRNCNFTAVSVPLSPAASIRLRLCTEYRVQQYEYNLSLITSWGDTTAVSHEVETHTGTAGRYVDVSHLVFVIAYLLYFDETLDERDDLRMILKSAAGTVVP